MRLTDLDHAIMLSLQSILKQRSA